MAEERLNGLSVIILSIENQQVWLWNLEKFLDEFS